MVLTSDMSRLPSDWAAALASPDYDPADADALVKTLYGGSAARVVYPGRTKVFRAFYETAPADVRAVILGQDPYPQVGKANGLAFSVDSKPTEGGSLDWIYKNLEGDPKVSFTRPGDGDLSAWAGQGVLLLNSALTVLDSISGSHRTKWRTFTEQVLQVLNAKSNPIPFLLLGTDTTKWRPTRITPPHLSIPTSHPVAWTTTNSVLFRTAFPFSEANEFLIDSGSVPISW